MATPSSRSINDWADFWRYQIGVNVIPADTKNKVPLVKWTRYQRAPVSHELHNQWKQENAFAKGISIIVGRVWHNTSKNGLYLIFVDLDNKKAIEEFCSRGGDVIPLDDMAKHVIIEQHRDEPDKAHAYFYSRHPFKKKSSDLSNLSSNNRSEIPSIEVKGSGEHGLAFCSPSLHKNGSNYEIIGSSNPRILDDLEKHINNICKKYQIPYLQDDDNSSNKSLLPIQDLFHVDTKIYEGHNRHEALLRVMESLIKRNCAVLSLDEIKKIAHEWNNQHCIPPLENQEEQNQWNDAIEFIKKCNKEINRENGSNPNGEDKESLKPVSVIESKRIHCGSTSVLGTIVSISNIYVVISRMQWHCSNSECLFMGEQIHVPPMALPVTPFYNSDGKASICPKCKSTGFSVELEYRNAKFIQLEDTQKADENERLDVILYEHMINNVVAGEVVEITGDIYIQRKTENSKSKKLVNILHAKSIEYVNRTEIKVTKANINSFHIFANFPNLIGRLISMFGPNVIGHDDAKLGILRSVVGGVENDGKRGRINTFFVGDPGTGKSMLMRECTKIKPNSRYVTAQNASGKSLTGIVDKENDSLVLRLGAIPLSKNAICAINEITSMSFDDQARMLDILEEGHFTVDKYGMHYEISSPTTILATANPIQSTWKDSQKISSEEIPILKTLLDRFDQTYPFRSSFSEEETKEYAQKMSLLRKRPIHNYNFLRKYLNYSSAISVTIGPEAEYMLNTFWTEAKSKGLLTNRMYNSIYRIAEAQAKLQLKKEVDSEIAKQAIESVQLMMIQYGETVKIISSPRDVAYINFLQILENTKTGITIYELCKIACKENQQILDYVGEKWSVEHNHKLRPIVDLLLNHSRVKQIGNRPIILRWIDDDGSSSDLSDGSDVSYTSFSHLKEGDILEIDDPKESDHLSPGIINLDNEMIHRTNSNIRTGSKSASDRSDQSDREVFNPSNNANRRIYRIRQRSDIWACQDCRFTGDVWFMQKHPCKVCR